MAYWHTGTNDGQLGPGLEGWRQSLRLACEWLTQRAMITTCEHQLGDSDFLFIDRYTDWRGAFRGEYSAARKKWDVFCPIWHGGQAIKALVLAHRVLGDDQLIDKAKQAASFILRHQISEANHPDCGLILAFESASAHVNTSAILESLDGLFVLSIATGTVEYAAAALKALRWVKRKMFVPDEGRFRDEYDPVRRLVLDAPTSPARGVAQDGRPLLDDAVFLTGYELSGDESLKRVAISVADRLLADEDPPGNWKNYAPNDATAGVLHPRHAYWWGRPMWRVYRATNEQRYLACCRRSAEWYTRAMRGDGGLFRDTTEEFSTGSFGHATSGTACAAILWHELGTRIGERRWRRPLRMALQFCRSVQFVNPCDLNLKGAILEKVVPPDGTDASPFYLRDLGTIFYVQALSMVMQETAELLLTHSEEQPVSKSDRPCD